MTRRRIFLLREDEELRELVEESFALEDEIQKLLARYPNLLAGDLINEESPRRWVLVSREVSVPDREEGAARWSLDHLFLDQDGVPTLVEVKRSSDTRIRREVIGQMLDYAANGLAYWPIEELRGLFEAECRREEVAPELRLGELLGEGAPDVEAFWQQVKANLKAGRIRLVFLADEIPTELRRIVEFLNSQMDPAEVLAVAVRRYVGDGLRTLVPQVFGQTAEAQTRKSTGRRRTRQWDEESFFAELETKADAPARRGARRVYEWMLQHLPELRWGQGVSMGSCFAVKTVGGIQYVPFALWSYGRLEFRFQQMYKGQKPFDDIGRRRDLVQRLDVIPGVDFPNDAVERCPTVSLAVFDSDEAWAEFERVMAWYLDQIGGGVVPNAESGGRAGHDLDPRLERDGSDRRAGR